MTLVRPRLTDHHGIAASQAQLDFAVPFLDEDVPLYVDPFLLWKSTAMQEQSLHLLAVNAFNHLGHLVNRGEHLRARDTLIEASECDEVGLGFSGTGTGRRLSTEQADEVLEVFKTIPSVVKNGFTHIETVQLLVDGIAKDRISDIFCSFIKSFLIDYTAEVSSQVGLPLTSTSVDSVFNAATNRFRSEDARIPVHPVTGRPILLVPKRWLRRNPWIGMDDYVDKFYKQEIAQSPNDLPPRAKIILSNRSNFGHVAEFVKAREKTQADCRSDPLFTQIPVLSMKRHFSKIAKIAPGKVGGADKKYEDAVVAMLASSFYPELDYASDQVRTESGAHIRDLIFYNTQSSAFLRDLANTYGSRQLVVEVKNVASLSTEHVNQLSRYLSHDFGSWGVLVTRHPAPKPVARNIVDLWSAHRKCVVVITDLDLERIANLYETKVRPSIDVLVAAHQHHVQSRPS